MKSTLILGLYYKDKHAACLGTLRDPEGMQHTGVVRWHGFGLASALHEVLSSQAQDMGAKCLQVLCNHPGLVEAFTAKVVGYDKYTGKPIKHIMLGLPDKRQEGRKVVPCGNENQWGVARCLAHYDRWSILYTDHLPNSQALWEEHYASIKATVG